MLPTCRAELRDLLNYSRVAAVENGKLDFVPEGVIARTDPYLFDSRGGRVMWKLKYKDFPSG